MPALKLYRYIAMAEVHYPSESRLRAAGFSSIVHVPVLFARSSGSRPKRYYCTEYNRYLRERALLEWTPRGTTADELVRSGRRLSYHTRKSLRDYAERLANFDDWLTATERDWRVVRYTEDIVLGYQADMTAGRWAKHGRKLKAATVNARVSEACCFLRWAAERGLRGPYVVIESAVRVRTGSSATSQGASGKTIVARAGVAPPDAERMLTIPNAEKITTWLRSVRARRGYTKELMCRFALQGALRLSEITGFRLCDFPDPDEVPWQMIGAKVRLLLTHGTKGRRADPVYAPELGPPRHIWIPVELAEELLDYRRLRRLRAANHFRKRFGRIPNQQSDFFFLSDYDGTPIKQDSLYRAWKTEPVPMIGWHPHSARSYWACTTLLLELEKQTRAAQKTLSDMPHAWVDEVGRTSIDTVIRPQLGHVGIETTLKYLGWVSQAVALSEYQIDWANHLSSDCDSQNV